MTRKKKNVVLMIFVGIVVAAAVIFLLLRSVVSGAADIPPEEMTLEQWITYATHIEPYYDALMEEGNEYIGKPVKLMVTPEQLDADEFLMISIGREWTETGHEYLLKDMRNDADHDPRENAEKSKRYYMVYGIYAGGEIPTIELYLLEHIQGADVPAVLRDELIW